MATLTQSQVEELRKKGLSDQKIQELATKKGFSLPEGGNILDRVRGVFDTRAKNVIDTVNKNVARYDTTKTDAVSTFVEKPALIGQTVGEIGKEAILGGGDLAYEGIKTVGRATGLNEPVSQAVRSGIEAAMKDPVVGPGVRILTDFYDSLDPDSKSAVDQAFAIGTLGAGGKTAQLANQTRRELGSVVKQEIASTAANPNTSKIATLYSKAIKPSVSGMNSEAKRAARDSQAQLAINTIVENKALKFIEEGDLVAEARLPRNLNEFSESVAQTKKSIFNQYDSLAKNAENKVNVDLTPVATELEGVAQNKILDDLAPEVATYARSRADTLLRRGSYSTVEAQDAIEQLNKSLQAFYRNPSYDTASKAAIDALIANNLRKSLDDAIESLSGEQYQALKTRYGALKSIEADVTKAALRDARKNFAGLIDFTDIFSGGQVLTGITTLNPTLIASGAFQKSIQTLIKRLNDPNRQIEELFKEAAKNAATAKEGI